MFNELADQMKELGNKITGYNQQLESLYTTIEDRQDTILGTDAKFWNKVGRVRIDLGPNVSIQEFINHMDEQYGIKLVEADNVNWLGTSPGILPVAEIVDEQKFLLFTLKYS